MAAIFLSSLRLGWLEFVSVVANVSWIVASVVRILSMLTFFTLLASSVEGRIGHFALFGSCFALMAVEITQIPQEMAKERFQGTLALLVASPAHLGIVFLIRYLPWFLLSLVMALSLWGAAGTLGFFPLNLHSQTLGIGNIVTIFIITALGVYAMTVFIGALSLRRVAGRNIYSDLISIMTISLCGVVAPVSSLPSVVAAFSRFLPLTNGLEALRALTTPDWGGADVVHLMVAQIAVSFAWILLTICLVRWLISRGLHDGSLNFS